MVDFNNIARLSEEEFAKFAKLIYEESGIFLKDTKIALLSNRLRKRLKVLKLATFSDYYQFIADLSNKSDEIESLIDVVSTNETYFFRNERQFNSLTDFCFPYLSEKSKSEKKLRIWSAGCSTGEEPYTIGICILENIHLFQGWNIEIVATDIAPSVLDFARAGDYSGRRIEKVPEHLLKKYFTQNKQSPEVFRINDNVKALVSFKHLNLFKDSYPEKIDTLFCRNVMIYFDKEHRRRLVEGFYKVLSRYGYLFIGHSETLHSLSNDFIYEKIGESPVYIPKERENEF